MIKKALLISCVSENKYEIPKGEFVLGRAHERSKSDIQINETGNEFVSGIHCKIYNDGEKIEVEDLKSMNGTYVNEEIIKSEERVLLNDKDELKLGRYTLKVKFTKESLLERLIKSFINKFFI